MLLILSKIAMAQSAAVGITLKEVIILKILIQVLIAGIYPDTNYFDLSGC